MMALYIPNSVIFVGSLVGYVVLWVSNRTSKSLISIPMPPSHGYKIDNN